MLVGFTPHFGLCNNTHCMLWDVSTVLLEPAFGKVLIVHTVVKFISQDAA